MDFVKRPLAVATLTAFFSFCVFVNIGIQFPLFLLPVIAVLSALLLGFSFFRRLKAKAAQCLKYLFLISAGLCFAVLLTVTGFSDREAELYEGLEVDVKFAVREIIWESDLNVCFKGEIIEADGEKESFFVAVESQEKYERGSIVEGKMSFFSFENTDTFDEERYYMSKGMILKGELSEGKVSGNAKKTMFDFFDGINEKLSARISGVLSEDSGALVDAVVLGNKGELKREIKRDFSRIGISHLIAISGMHISYISAAFYGMSRKLGSNRKISSFVCIFLMLFYMGLTGFSASAVRAAILCCFVSISVLFGFCHDGITAVGVCGLGMVTVCPYFAFDVGMQLSFSAYLGCLAAIELNRRIELKREEKRTEKESKAKLLGIALYPPRKVRRFLCSFLKKLESSVIFTVIATAFTLPVTLLYYDSISLVSPLSNLLFIPLFSLVMYAGIAVILVSGIPFIGTAVVFFAEKLIGGALLVAEKTAMVEGISVSLGYPFSTFIVAVLFLCVVGFICAKKKASKVFGSGVCICIILYGAGILVYNGIYADTVSFTRIDGKNGDGFVVTAKAETVFCDFSSGSASEASRALNAASSLCRDGIDTLILTDYNKGHMDLVSRLSETTYLKRVFLPVVSDADKIKLKKEIEEYLGQRKIEFYEFSLKKGDIGEFPFDISETQGGAIILSAIGEDADFLYLPHDFNNYTSAKRFLGDENNAFVVLGKGRGKADLKELKKAKVFFGEASVNAVVNGEDREHINEITGVNIFLPKERFTFRIKLLTEK